MSVKQLIDVHMRARGASAFSSQMGSIASAAGKVGLAVGAIGGILTAAIGGVAALGVAKLGAEFETTQNTMAGFLHALGEVDNFPKALKVSSVLMRQIRSEAAKLPGEASEYIQVFTMALPEVQRSVKGSLIDMVKFTNKVSALGATLGIDARQVGNDLRRMLQVGAGAAGTDVRLWAQMLPFIRQLKDQASLTAKEFNQFTEAKRADILARALNGVNDMLDNASGTWDAIKGAVQTVHKEVIRMATAPLFEGMKAAGQRFADSFLDAEGNLTQLGIKTVAIGRIISEQIVRMFQLAYVPIQAAGEIASKVIGRVIEIAQVAVPYIAPLAQGLIDMVKIVIANMPVDALGRIFQTLMEATKHLGLGFRNFIIGLYKLVGPVLGGLIRSVIFILDTFTPGILLFAKVVRVVFIAAGRIMELISYVVKGWIMLGRAIFKAGQWKAFDALFKGLSTLGNLIKDLAIRWFSWLGMDFTDPASEMSKSMGNEVSDFVKSFEKSMGELTSMFKGEIDWSKYVPTNNLTLPNTRAKMIAHLDFRHSRFSIEQKFEEGFDPDRVAVVFAEDLQRLGEQRLQSGFEPIFSVR